MTEAVVDMEKVEAFAGQIGGFMTGGTLCFAIWLGDELGLYRAMSDSGPLAADDLAARTSCNPRLVREWLDGQAAGGLVTFDPAGDTYELSAEGVMTLSNEASPAFLARGMNAVVSFFVDRDKVKSAFLGDGALSWSDHDESLFHGTEWFFRTGYQAFLPDWIRALDGVAEKLVAGATIADVGCGHGASSVVIAQAFPKAQVTGFDFHSGSIEIARERAAEGGVSENTQFEVADAKSYGGSFDLICFFDCLHDMGDPVGIAAYAREHLAPGGTVLLVEPFALDDRAENIANNPMAALLYTASTGICTPNSLSQEVGLGLGAQAGEARLRDVFEQAGFTSFRRAAETPMNLILEAKA